MSSPSERNEAPEPLTGQPVGTTRQHVSLFARSADLPRGKRRIQGIRRVRAARHLSQLLFAALILGASVRHQLAVRSGTTPSTDALCPFGGVETLVTWITTGNFISKTHISNLILFAAVVVATVLVGNAFCGWVCPFGALQDALSWLRRTLHLPTFEPPHRVDRVLRWGRFVTLGVILYFSISTAKLWFAGWDPCVNLFGLGWLFGDGEKMPLALSVIGVTVVGSLLVERAWCRYLCPFGAVFKVLGVLSLTRIRRSTNACIDCELCDRVCPVNITPSKATPMVSTDCVGCLDCVATCPVNGALTLNAPVLLGLPVTPDSAPPATPGDRKMATSAAKEV